MDDIKHLFEDYTERLLYASRWILSPMYIILILVLILILIRFVGNVIHFITIMTTLSDNEWIIQVLELLDLSLVANLVLIVAFSGYENFVSKIDVAEEVSAIVAEAAAKEARAFEREVDRIKGKTQTLYDKIFEIDHSQYENDLRKIQQEYLQTAQELQESGVLSYYKNDLDYLFGRQQQELAKRAAKDKNYRKSPEGATERGGNGIMVISGDKITDDGLIQSIQKEIGLLDDENQIRAQLLQKQRHV